MWSFFLGLLSDVMYSQVVATIATILDDDQLKEATRIYRAAHQEVGQSGVNYYAAS